MSLWKLGLKEPAKIGDNLVSLSAYFEGELHRFTVTAIRNQGTISEALVEANGMIHSPVVCGTLDQYTRDCASIATSVSGKHDPSSCPNCRNKRENF